MLLSFDISEKTWSVLDKEQTEVFLFGFTDGDNEEVVFSDLSFGISIFDDEGFIISKRYPEDGVKYISTTDSHIEGIVVGVYVSGKTYQYDAWVENNGERSEYSFSATTEIPISPYKSWIWDSNYGAWIPPIDYPTDNQEYYWDEETLSWIPVTFE